MSTEYTSQRNRVYTITPADDFEPITGDNIGLYFEVSSELVRATPTIRISRTLQSVWQIPPTKVREALINLGVLKIEELIEQGQDLRAIDYMFITSDPVVTASFEDTLENLKSELGDIKQISLSQGYIEKKRQYNILISDIFNLYDEMDSAIEKCTGHKMFVTSVSGIKTQFSSQEITTKEEYHWILLLTAMPFEMMDFSGLDSQFPTEQETGMVRARLPRIADGKEDYYILGMISSLTQLDIIIRNHDRTSHIDHVRVLKAIGGLRNMPPTHSNESYIECRRRLKLPDRVPTEAGENGTNFIDEVLIVQQNLKESLDTVKDKIVAISSRVTRTSRV